MHHCLVKCRWLMTCSSWANWILVFENISGTLCIISYGRLCVHHHAIKNQDIWYDAHYHLATKCFWRCKHQIFDRIKESCMFWKKSDNPVCYTGCSDLQPMHSAKACSAESSSAKSDVSVFLEVRTVRTEQPWLNQKIGRLLMVSYSENPACHIVDRKFGDKL
jgi:hypothetical protein